MRPTALVGEVLSVLTTRVNLDGDVSSPAEHSALGTSNWLVLALASLIALLAVGGAGRVARRLARRSTPELAVLLDRSAAFYGRWPEDRLATVPLGELVTEAARCRRIIEMVEWRTTAGIAGGPAERGPIDGLQAWIALLSKQIDGCAGVPSGAA